MPSPEHTEPTGQPATEQRPTDEMVGFLFELSKGAPDLAMTQVRSLQTRGVQALTAGTVLVAFVSLVGNPHAPTVAFIIIGAIAYVATAMLALLLLRPSYINGLPGPTELMATYGHQRSVPAARDSLLTLLVRDEGNNTKIVETAECLAKWAVRATFAEIVAMALALILYHLPV
jgi:hypothetical protein